MAHYVAALGELGIGNTSKAKSELTLEVELNPYLLDARTRLAEIK
jgi:hypothetical protein